jgi:voltage-gated potassium channel
VAERGEVVARRRRRVQRARARSELRQFMARTGLVLAIVAVLMVGGTVALSLTEAVSPAYAFSWTLDTITTLGTIPEPRDVGGRVVIVCIELFGIGTLFYGLATVAEFFVSGQLSGVLAERRMQREIDTLTDHFIVCGYGRVGRQVVRDLRRAAVSFVGVDDNPDTRELARADGILRIESDPTADEVLIAAGIERARGVIACVDSDAENIFITLTARGLRPDVLIIARASAEDAERKLLRAGADRVISPYKTSGSEMARTALHPSVGGSVAVADYRMDEIEVAPGCAGVGRPIEEVRGSAMIVAMWRNSGRLEPQPAPDTVIEPGDRLVALGTPEALERLEARFDANPARTG